MAIEDLIAVVPPPEHPIDPGSDEWWSQAEAELGFSFPSDYRRLCQLYGRGAFYNYLYIIGPARNFATWALGRIDDIKGYLRDTDREERFPYKFYPEPGGLLPVGQEDNSSYVIHWEMRGEPDEWPIVVLLYGEDVDDWEFDGNLTSFLATVLRDEFPCAGISPQDKDPRVFVPMKPSK